MMREPLGVIKHHTRSRFQHDKQHLQTRIPCIEGHLVALWPRLSGARNFEGRRDPQKRPVRYQRSCLQTLLGLMEVLQWSEQQRSADQLTKSILFTHAHSDISTSLAVFLLIYVGKLSNALELLLLRGLKCRLLLLLVHQVPNGARLHWLRLKLLACCWLGAFQAMFFYFSSPPLSVFYGYLPDIS